MILNSVSLCVMSFFFKTKSTYKLTILASDMGGNAGGLTGTGEIEINLTDINDNIPTLAQETVYLTQKAYSYSIKHCIDNVPI